MEVQAEHSSAEIKHLQRCLNDLLSLLALPAIWSGGDPSQVLHTLLETLVRMLHLDLVAVRVKDPVSEAPVEIVRVAKSRRPMPPEHEICEALSHCLGDASRRWPPLLRNILGDQDVSIVPLPLGLQGELGVIIAAAEREDFPRQTEALLLNVAANQASIGLQEAWLRSQQKRVADELDRQVAQRTAELAAAEERWRSVFENSAIGVALTDLNGRFLAANPVYEEMVGYPEQELQKLSFLDITHEEDLEPNRTLIGELLAGKRQQFQIEKQYRRKNGSLVWVRNSVSVVPGTERVPRFLMALSEDITERKRAEEKLRRSEALLAEVQLLSVTGGFSWRVDRNEVTFSEEAYRIFEFEKDTPVTLERIGNRVHPEDIPLLTEKIQRAQGGDSDHDYEIRLQMPDGSVKFLHTISRGIRDREGRLEIIGAAQDITRRKVSEEALGKARSELARVSRVTTLGVLTASIAHEVNQPLSGIITNAGTCLRMLGADPPNVDGACETARRTIRDGNRMSEVITRLRALFSKKDAATESMNLNEAVREVIALLVADLQKNRVILRPELADDLPLVTGDRVQLQQVILNLLRNGSDAMSAVEDRPRQLVIKTEREEGDRVRLTVQDAGVGFDPQAADRLFDTFYTTKGDGMGVGLSVSRSIIESHHGRLWATPNDGPGAAFSFSIPRAPEGLARADGIRNFQAPAVGDTNAP
ncbi:MAG: PAS domain S-box protein [Candidatus Sulfotelmatobacter sp.]